MGGNFSNISTNKLNFQDFDGLGLQRPRDLPLSTPESHRKLIQLLLTNHLTYCVLSGNSREYFNDTHHVLISAYYLGAKPEVLYSIYEGITKSLEEWKEDSPQEVTQDDWPEFVCDKTYVRGFFDFFKEQIQENSSDYQWKATVKRYIFDEFEKEDTKEKTQLFNGILGGIGNTLLHLGVS